ncbi:hypothetical protein [Dongia deserti]|uniref:hypothetical protein n=1 Tax=Dongia deserti TaxID=2268030 RepID=UPI000E656AB8|nr:hypothetical protein [Dongia deserti]
MIGSALSGLVAVLAGLLAGCSAPPAPEPLPMASMMAATAQGDSSRQCGAMSCRSNGVPYINDKGAIVIFPGEQFVIAFEIQDDKIVSAVPKPTGGHLPNAIEVSFKEIDSGMMLSLQSHLPMDLKYDAAMKAPDNRLVYTSSCPVRASLGSYESWPHPIKFLELSNFRIQDGGPCQ